ncbi:helix-turn-helix domain-containing protein [Paeniglutamicibacter sp. R2-26]|uniref:helix-turn-helix domain-containing protein n=1 Tax=Paeniglutamicibacter sp. R2-26 TaxID=3144417 RepID=UPI003EE75D1B
MNDPAAVDSLLEQLPDLATTEEIAELMRVKTGTILKWSQKFGLKSISVGPRIRRFRKEDLRSFLLHSDELNDPASDPASGEVDDD